MTNLQIAFVSEVVEFEGMYEESAQQAHRHAVLSSASQKEVAPKPKQNNKTIRCSHNDVY